jgi:hypothetical protein
MDWIKRNLYFVIGAVVAVALLGGAGWYGFTRYQSYNASKEKFNAAYDELKRLHGLRPSPGNDKVNNTRIAEAQEADVRALMARMGRNFQPVPRVVPLTTNSATQQPQVSGEDYAASLRRVIAELQKEAAAGSVTLPPDYAFSFSAQRSLIKFAPGSLEPLADQLADVRVLAGILNQAKVNAIDSIRRERVGTDDAMGPATDYCDRVSVTNELAVMAPYELVFRCFSPELATVLTALANSPHSLVVKGINVEPAAAAATVDPRTGLPVNPEPVFVPQPVLVQPVIPQQPPTRSGDFSREYRSRAGLAPTYQPPAPTTIMVAPPAPKIQTVLDERQLKVTVLVYVTRLLPPKS